MWPTFFSLGVCRIFLTPHVTISQLHWGYFFIHCTGKLLGVFNLQNLCPLVLKMFSPPCSPFLSETFIAAFLGLLDSFSNFLLFAFLFSNSLFYSTFWEFPHQILLFKYFLSWYISNPGVLFVSKHFFFFIASCSFLKEMFSMKILIWSFLLPAQCFFQFTFFLISNFFMLDAVLA